jgi:hypothetical protein
VSYAILDEPDRRWEKNFLTPTQNMRPLTKMLRAAVYARATRFFRGSPPAPVLSATAYGGGVSPLVGCPAVAISRA